MKIQLILAIAIFLLLSANNLSAITISKVVYGEDNRHETNEYSNAKFITYAKSVAGRVKTSELTTLPNGNYGYEFKGIDLCPDERFADQPSLATCSGFLVTPDTLVTAGHCIQNSLDCSKYKWVFDFISKTNEISPANIYSCERIIGQQLYDSAFKMLDYSVIKLDRAVGNNRAPLKFRKSGRANHGTPLVIIGHPSGLPQKIADGAIIQKMNTLEKDEWFKSLFKRRYYYTANLDSFAGNSGSPVFNAKTGLIEGILVEGAPDYYSDPVTGCLRPYILSNSRWDSQEKIFRITKVKPLKKIR